MQRIDEVLASRPDVRPSPRARRLERPRGRVAFEAVSFGYGENAVFEGLDLIVRPAEIIAIVGPTGAGKTTLLNILSSSIPDDERIITVEDAAELILQQEHTVRLETRPPNIEGRGEVTARDLVRNSLRMRPDRIIVGEVRGAEALDMLQAMNTGHEGSLTTVHANSPRDALWSRPRSKRLRMMCNSISLMIPLSPNRSRSFASLPS